MLNKALLSGESPFLRLSFQDGLRAIVATGLAAKHNENPCRTYEDAYARVGTSSLFRKRLIFSDQERREVGHTLFPGLSLTEDNRLSSLLGTGSYDQLGVFLEGLRGVPQAEILGTVRALCTQHNFAIHETQNPAVCKFVFTRSELGEEDQEVFFFIGEISGETLEPEQRTMGKPFSHNAPTEVSEAILGEVLAHPRLKAFENTLSPEFEYDTNLISRLGRDPFTVVLNILMQSGDGEFSTPLEYAVEFNMMLDGVLLPSQAKLSAILDAFYPFFDEYTEGFKGYMLHRAGSSSNESNARAPSQRTLGAEGRAFKCLTGLDYSEPYTQEVIASLREKSTTNGPCTSEERRAMESDRYSFIKAFGEAYQKQQRDQDILSRYTANNLFRDLLMLTGMPLDIVEEKTRLARSSIQGFKEGRPSLPCEDVEKIFALFGNPSPGYATAFLKAVVSAYKFK